MNNFSLFSISALCKKYTEIDKMQNTRNLLKFLFRFKCPKCDASSFEAKVMQAHLLRCKKDQIAQKAKDLFDLVEDEIRLEMNFITMVSESNDGEQNSQIGCDDFEFEDSKSQPTEVNISPIDPEPHSNHVKQEPMEPKSSGLENFDDESENFDDKNEHVQALSEDFGNTNGPKIDAVFSHEQAVVFHENKGSESTKRADLNGNKMKKTYLKHIHPRWSHKAKSFVCDWANCGRKFKTSQERKIHYRRHTGEKPYACDWKNCSKKFATSSQRTDHYLTHTGDKPYICDWENCTKRFARYGSMKSHYKNRHGLKHVLLI